MFAEKGSKTPLKEDVARGLADEFGGKPEDWQHCKAIGWLDVNDESVKAEFTGFKTERQKKNSKSNGGFMTKIKTVKYIGDTSPLELTHGKLYDVLSIERGWYRIVDDTGEDYLYPAGNFEDVEEH